MIDPETAAPEDLDQAAEWPTPAAFAAELAQLDEDDRLDRIHELISWLGGRGQLDQQRYRRAVVDAGHIRAGDWRSALAEAKTHAAAASRGGDGQDIRSAATVLVEIARERYRFGVSEDSEPYAVPEDGPKVVSMLRGGKTSLRGKLARTYFTATGRAAPQAALADALQVIEGFAQEEDPQRLYMRVARHGGALWIDLGDQTGRAVRITAEGWSIADEAPVLFKRTPLNGPLPDPERGVKLDELWAWLNVASEDRPLVAAWLVAALFCDIPHPILGLFGEQGTGKTTALKLLALTLDPGPVPARKPPKDADSWVTAAQGSWVVGLDNLSDIPSWLSDSMCRAVTGDGDVRRRLYTDADLAVYAFRRCLALNGIDLGELRGDLAERLLPIDLATISEADRMEEESLWPRWREVHPGILGAVLDLAASVLAEMPAVQLAARPRMADFARILTAVDRVLGTVGAERYMARQGALAVDSLTGDEFITQVADKVAGTLAGTFTGTSKQLRELVTPREDGWRAPRGWPKNTRQVTERLRRQAPVMRKAGWIIDDDGGANHLNAVQWNITPPPQSRDAGNSGSPTSRDRHFAGQGLFSPPGGQLAADSRRESADDATPGGNSRREEAGFAGPGENPQVTPKDASHASNARHLTGPSRIGRRVKIARGGVVPDGAIYVGRPAPRVRLAGSPYANRHPVGRPLRDGDKPCPVPECGGAAHNRGEAIAAYQADLRAAPELAAAIARDFAEGQDAACWCDEGLPCHGDVILAVAREHAAAARSGRRA